MDNAPAGWDDAEVVGTYFIRTAGQEETTHDTWEDALAEARVKFEGREAVYVDYIVSCGNLIAVRVLEWTVVEESDLARLSREKPDADWFESVEGCEMIVTEIDENATSDPQIPLSQ